MPSSVKKGASRGTGLDTELLDHDLCATTPSAASKVLLQMIYTFYFSFSSPFMSGSLRWFGCMIRIDDDEFVKRLYEGRLEGEGAWGRVPVKWINITDE